MHFMIVSLIMQINDWNLTYKHAWCFFPIFTFWQLCYMRTFHRLHVTCMWAGTLKIFLICAGYNTHTDWITLFFLMIFSDCWYSYWSSCWQRSCSAWSCHHFVTENCAEACKCCAKRYDCISDEKSQGKEYVSGLHKFVSHAVSLAGLNLFLGTSVVILYYHRKHKLPYCPGYIASGRTVEKTVLLALVV
jgi:hypothetical protein